MLQVSIQNCQIFCILVFTLACCRVFVFRQVYLLVAYYLSSVGCRVLTIDHWVSLSGLSVVAS
jgi:hypothetical protein